MQILRLDGSPSANSEQLPVPQGCSLEAVSTSATAADTPAHVLGAGEIQGFCDRHLAVCVWDERSSRNPALVLRAQHARDRLWETLSCACSISCNIVAAGSTQGWVTLWDIRKAQASTRAIMNLGVPRKVRIGVAPHARALRHTARMEMLTCARTHAQYNGVLCQWRPSGSSSSVTRLLPTPGVTAFELSDGAVGTFHNASPLATACIHSMPQQGVGSIRPTYAPTASWLPGGVLSWLHREDDGVVAFTHRPHGTSTSSSSLRAAFHQGVLLYAADSGSTAYAFSSDSQSVAVSALRQHGGPADLVADVVADVVDLSRVV